MNNKQVTNYFRAWSKKKKSKLFDDSKKVVFF